jgi:hypothetical protein
MKATVLVEPRPAPPPAALAPSASGADAAAARVSSWALAAVAASLCAAVLGLPFAA